MTGFLTEAAIEQITAKSGRRCGECSMCCLLLDVPHAGKPKHGWCPHCRPGHGGCTIYETRPEVCRRFACMWLVNPTLPDYWKPSRSNMVLDFHVDSAGDATLRVHTHPDSPGAWRQEPYRNDIAVLSKRFKTIICEGGHAAAKAGE